LSINISNHNIRTFIRKGQTNGSSDAIPTAGNDRDFIFQSHVQTPLCFSSNIRF
jgi:hypothetical protein